MGLQFTKLSTTAAVLALSTLFAMGGCRSKTNPFPDTDSVKGWAKTGETRTFAAKDLYQYIDGDAEQYIAAGVVSTSTADYKYEGQLEAVIDVHTMGDAAGASKIMGTAKGGDSKAVQIGDAGVAYAQSVIFRKGPHLVRIVAYEATPGSQDALIALARGVEAKL